MDTANRRSLLGFSLGAAVMAAVPAAAQTGKRLTYGPQRQAIPHGMVKTTRLFNAPPGYVNGVDTRWLESVEGPSGVAVILAGGGDNMIVVAPGANSTLDSTALAAEAFAGARLVLCQLEIPLDGVSAAARCAHEAGAAFMLDPAPARALPRDLLEEVDWLVPNESEACALLGRDALGDPLDAAGALTALGSRGVVLKRGAEGVVLVGADKMPVVIPAPAVEVADTIAAGDAFAGAFAVALGEGLPPAGAARFATVAASLSVTRTGAQPSMARRTEIDAAMRRYGQGFPA